jgi:hypothetical protein
MSDSLRPKISGFILAAVIMLCLATGGTIAVFALGKYEHASEMKFVGPKKCAKCHQQQFASWSETRMARSFEVLRPGVKAKEKKMAKLDPSKDYTHDPKCLQCHTTGFGLVGGFVSIETTPDMAGVTCEACHGYGGVYAESIMRSDKPSFRVADARRAGLIYPPSEAVCIACHNSDGHFVGMDYKFDYEQQVRKGTHQHFQLKYEHGE